MNPIAAKLRRHAAGLLALADNIDATDAGAGPPRPPPRASQCLVDQLVRQHCAQKSHNAGDNAALARQLSTGGTLVHRDQVRRAIAKLDRRHRQRAIAEDIDPLDLDDVTLATLAKLGAA